MQPYLTQVKLKPGDLLEKLRGMKGTEWQKRGFVAVISTEEGSQGVCMLQCSHCRELKSACNPAKTA